MLGRRQGHWILDDTGGEDDMMTRGHGVWRPGMGMLGNMYWITLGRMMTLWRVTLVVRKT